MTGGGLLLPERKSQKLNHKGHKVKRRNTKGRTGSAMLAPQGPAPGLGNDGAGKVKLHYFFQVWFSLSFNPEFRQFIQSYIEVRIAEDIGRRV